MATLIAVNYQHFALTTRRRDHPVTTIEQDPPDERISRSDQQRLGVERRGIEYIPDDERHGRPWQLGAMWSGLVMNVLTVVYGTLLVAMGLNWWQALLAIVLGNLTWLIAGVVSIAGPTAGTTTFGVSQMIFGRIGVRPVAFFNWIMMLGYEVLDLVVMVLATGALLDMAGVKVSIAGHVLIVVILSVLQAVLPLLGHAAITKVLRLLAIPFAAIFLVMACLVADDLHVDDGAPASWALFLGGVALAASGSGLGWSSSAADYSRYLPAGTSRYRIIAAVTAGGGIPQALLMALGAAIAIALPDAGDPIAGLSTVFPGWLVVIYLVLVIVQMLSLNGVDLYSSGVTLQALGVRISRWQAVLVDGVLCGFVGAAVVLSGSFYQFVSTFLLFMIIWFAPWAGVFLVDLARRRGRYPHASAAVYQSFSRAGVGAQVLGMIAAALCINTTVFVGPVAAAFGGADLSIAAGLLAGALTYPILLRLTSRGEAA
ncbi:putative permease, nucleobase cation symporter-1 family [Mycolicibacterium canariasense]|uniref:Putative permease, nucleobase cation symporter-1 family n=1 Tax=Mycolicibacterium canariasense TaxID=228230 RepID=A0A124E1J6_MYCCR|nr:putative permease, nucleobase cation symporter-1 family [Mycolicibacterium canariasense]